MFSDVVVCLKHFVDMKTEQSCSTNRPNHKAGTACLQRNHSPSDGASFKARTWREEKKSRNASRKRKESVVISERGIAFV